MGNADRPELGEELTASFCRTDPEIAARFARVTFMSDNRADLAGGRVPTLVLQCSDDVIAPPAVGRVRAPADPRARRFVQLDGHRATARTSAPRRRRSTRSGRSSEPACVEQSAEDLYENAPCGYLSAAPDGTIVRVNGTFLRWTGYTPRGAGRRQALPGPADRRRPDLPRDALRAAAADAGQRARDRRRHRRRRRPPAAGAGQLRAPHATRPASRRSCARRVFDATRAPEPTSASCWPRATASAGPASTSSACMSETRRSPHTLQHSLLGGRAAARRALQRRDALPAGGRAPRGRRRLARRLHARRAAGSRSSSATSSGAG